MYLFDSEAQGLIDGPHGGTHHACILTGGTHPTVATIILLTVDAIRSATAWAWTLGWLRQHPPSSAQPKGNPLVPSVLNGAGSHLPPGRDKGLLESRSDGRKADCPPSRVIPSVSMCSYPGTHHPDLPSLGRVGGLAALGGVPSVRGPGAVRSGEYSVSPAGLSMGAQTFHQQWTRVIGTVGSQIRI